MLLSYIFQLSTKQGLVSKLVTSRSKYYRGTQVFLMVLDTSRSPIPYPFRSKYYPKADTLQTNPSALERNFSTRINKMLKVGGLKPVHEATPWINSFVLVEGKDKLGKLKLRICLDPTNLNKVIVREPYHFKTPDITHLLADARIMSVCVIARKVIGMKNMNLHSFLQLSTLSLGDLGIL